MFLIRGIRYLSVETELPASFLDHIFSSPVRNSIASEAKDIEWRKEEADVSRNKDKPSKMERDDKTLIS